MCIYSEWLITSSSIFGMIQSISWIALSITGALTYLCVVPVAPYKSESDFFRVTFVKLYFEGPGCIPDGSYLGDFDRKYREVLGLFTPDKVFAVMVTYLILNVLYFVLSVLFYRKRKEEHNRQIMGSWSALTLILCAIDVVLTYEAVNEFFTLRNYMNTDRPELTEVYTSSAKGTLGDIPYVTLVLALISSKFVVFWVWNFVIGAFFLISAFCCGKRKGKSVEGKNDNRKEIIEELRQRNEDRQTSVSVLNGKYIGAFDIRSNPESINNKRSMEAVTRFTSVPENLGQSKWSYTVREGSYWPSKAYTSRDWEMTNEGFVNDEPYDPEKDFDFDHNLKNFEPGQKKIKIVKPPIGKPVMSEAFGRSSTT